MLVLGQPSPSVSTFLRPSISQTIKSGVGILTYFPFAYAISLGLGPDFPREDKPSPGNLGFPARGILTLFLATHSCILTCDTSSVPYGTPSPAYTTLSYQSVKDEFHSFGLYLSPVTLSAQKLSTSELLRTL